jgi:four helix bundle protein
MSYQNLQVYQRAHAFGVDCHRVSLVFPKYELYESGSQLRRAAKSVSANIVEGHGRKEYRADHPRFLVIAMASNDEAAEWLRYLADCHPDKASLVTPLLAENAEIGRMLNTLASRI